MNKIFQVPANLEGVSPLKDGGVSLRFHTQEVTNSQKVMLMDYFQKFGWLLFKEEEFDEEDIPEEKLDIEGRKIKTPSQRLRAVMYVYAKKIGIEESDQDSYYKQQIERIIDKYKKLIEEMEV